VKSPRAGLRRPIPWTAWASLALSAGVVAGGFFFPVLGLAVPVLLLVALAGTFLRKRWFCGQACPRGSILSHFLGRWSAYCPMPAFLRSDGVRMAGCAFLLVCAVGQTMRLWPRWEALGWFFWLVCVGTLGLAATLALVFKPRAWCAVCPLGTLQQTLARGGKAEQA
jgi:polyferredoxin